MIGYQAAIDEMFGIVKATLVDDTGIQTLLGYTMDVRWPMDALPNKPDITRLWAKVSKQTVTDKQACLTNVNGVRVFETRGLLYVQLFCPRDQPAALTQGNVAASNMQAAFRKQSPSGEIWFYDQAIRELPETPENYPINVVTSFYYRTLASES